MGIRRTKPTIDESSNDHSSDHSPGQPGLDARIVPDLRTPDGVLSYYPSYATMRLMARDVVDNTHITAVEKGLALSILAIIDDFEDYYRAHETG